MFEEYKGWVLTHNDCATYDYDCIIRKGEEYFWVRPVAPLDEEFIPLYSTNIHSAIDEVEELYY